MIRYVGLDVHKQTVQVAILDDKGDTLLMQNVPATRQALVQFARQHLWATDRVALEATTNSWAVARLLQPFVGEVVVSNPLTTKAIAQAKIKTDKIDATVLAQLLRCNFLPAVWIPDEQTQTLRTLTHRRSSLVAERTRLKNRIHAVLHQALIPVEAGVDDLFSKKGRRWLQQLELSAQEREFIESDCRLLEATDKELSQLDQQLAKHAYSDDRVKLLMTLPGADYTVAQTVLAALGDISRFADGDHAASYLGLVPSTYQSGPHCYHGPITKRGSRHARWILIQAAQHVAAHPGPLGVFFRRLLKKKNRNVAVVATARKLVVVAYHMLKNNEPYRYAQPAATQNKLARLRVKATGKRRTTGPKKGCAPSPNYGSGKRTREVPALAQVCSQEGLPPPTPLAALKAAEQRILKQAGVIGFVQQIQRSHRAVRHTKTANASKRR